MNELLDSYGRGYRLRLVDSIATVGGAGQITGPSQWFGVDFFTDDSAKDAMESAAKNDASAYRWNFGAINIYVTQRSGSFSGGICSFPSSDEIIIVSGDHSGSGTVLLHEIGHYFDLCHTQGCSCDECDDCDEPGNDQIDDTIEDVACWNQDQIAQHNFGIAYASLPASQRSQVDDVFFNLMSYHFTNPVRLTELQLDRWTEAANLDRSFVTSGSPTPTNHVQQALAHFDTLLATQTNSPLRGRAFLGRGWALWLDGKYAESAVAFKAAMELLPWSEELAIAKFKLGDVQFALRDFTNAIASYRAVTNEFASMPRARDTLLDQALFQMTRAQTETRDRTAAAGTLRTLLDWFPGSAFCDRAQLLVGQSCLEAQENSRAREIFAELVQRAPESPLRPRAELAAARSHAQEGDFRAAIAAYTEWISRFPTNALRAQAEFDLAGSHWRSGDEASAFQLLTNFVTSFPTNELAPLAQYWVGDYFMRQGDAINAQKKFQNIIENTNWPVTRLKYQARLAAGRAAYARQAWNEAAGERGHFTVLINDVQNCPPDIAAEALFAFADTRTREESGPAQPLEKFDEARTIFAKIIPFATNEVASRLVPLAWGRIGDCSLQLASADPKQFEAATNAYRRVITNRLADLPARSLAEFGLARALEAMVGGTTGTDGAGLRGAAFDHYYNVALGANAAPGEEPDPYWIKEAGFAAARIAEEQRRWTVALNLYKRLADVLPILRPRLQEKMERVHEQMRREKN